MFFWVSLWTTTAFSRLPVAGTGDHMHTHVSAVLFLPVSGAIGPGPVQQEKPVGCVTQTMLLAQTDLSEPSFTQSSHWTIKWEFIELNSRCSLPTHAFRNTSVWPLSHMAMTAWIGDGHKQCNRHLTIGLRGPHLFLNQSCFHSWTKAHVCEQNKLHWYCYGITWKAFVG